MAKLLKLINTQPTLGCDPELFLRKNVGGVKEVKYVTVGSELAIPREGITTTKGNGIVRDGVQVELHPMAGNCREGLGERLAECIVTLDKQAKAKRLEIDFAQVVKVSKETLEELAPENQVLGCHPSKNYYGTKAINVDGRKMLLRSGSGHIHLGWDKIGEGKQISPEKLVPILDLVAGIPGVLLDRNPDAAVRRKYYGRAGEYRLPDYGLEYRTLSNFWLRGYWLMSLMMAQCRQAVDIVYTADYKKPTVEDGYRDLDVSAMADLLKPIQFEAGKENEVSRAINNNDFKTAKQIWEGVVRPVLARQATYQGLDSNTVEAFDWLVEQGIDTFVPKMENSYGIVTQWQYNSTYQGWERYADYNILRHKTAKLAEDHRKQFLEAI